VQLISNGAWADTAGELSRVARTTCHAGATGSLPLFAHAEYANSGAVRD
jgi:hypothetical protein